jgi:hypothetical protein
MEASVGAIEFFFAAVVVGVTHSSERLNPPPSHGPRQKANAAMRPSQL